MFLFCIVFEVILTGCKLENDASKEKDALTGVKTELKEALLNVSYEITITQFYKYDVETLTDLDIAHLNPSEDKHRVEMVLFPDGSVNTTIEELEFERNIIIQHQVLPNDIPGVKKTITIGNTISMYDVNGKLLATHNVENPRQMKLVEQIREMGSKFSDEEIAQAFATMQGAIFDQQMEQFIAKAEAKGQVIEHDERYVTMRMSFSETEPQAKGDCVMIVDKSINKIVASAVYDEDDKMNSRTYYGYAKECPQILNVTRTDQLIRVPSGVEVWQLNTTKYDNLKVNVNPFKN